MKEAILLPLLEIREWILCLLPRGTQQDFYLIVPSVTLQTILPSAPGILKPETPTLVVSQRTLVFLADIQKWILLFLAHLPAQLIPAW